MQGQSKKNSLKLRKIKNLMTRGNFDILLLQETRSDGTEIELKRWRKIFNSKQIFLSDFGPNSVGAGIIIGNDQVFKVHTQFSDPEGRFVGVIGDHEDGQFLILSFYSPSIEGEIKDFVLNKLSSQLAQLGTNLPEFIIFGGRY